jgi:DNA-binding XRE family transcriptional regulator
MKKRWLLRVLRAASEPRLTQSQLARKAGLATFRYWQIENGEGPVPSEVEKGAIAAALKTTPADIAWPEFERAQAS